MGGCECQAPSGFPLEFVGYGEYSPHSTEKSGAPPPSFATALILWQVPGAQYLDFCLPVKIFSKKMTESLSAASPAEGE